MEAPLQLTLRLAPERRVTPADAADVLQSLDDALRIARAARRLTGTEGSQDPEIWAQSLWRMAEIGGGESPLTLRHVEFGSPLQVLTEVPWEAVVGSGALWVFLGQIERIWHMRGRILVESARLQTEHERQRREYWEERLAAAQAEDAYWVHRLSASGRHLQGPPPPPAFTGVDGHLSDSPEVSDSGTTSRTR